MVNLRRSQYGEHISIIDPRRSGASEARRRAVVLGRRLSGDWSNSKVSIGDTLFGMLFRCHITPGSEAVGLCSAKPSTLS